MAGGGFAGDPVLKIKGGRWTVVRFFFVALGFTIGWMTVSSLLAHYKLKYGPAILLQMNIAYFLPSIPLLVASAFLDEWLDRRLGVAKTILVRLLFGLGGCAAVTAAWPFAHSSRRVLLSLTVLLGLVSGAAFSASYQLVARFANKNTISLGLGCVGSGIVTLLLQLALAVGPTPTRGQELWLFELTAAAIVLSMAAAFSLLIRHWAAIEGPAESPTAAAAEPLLGELRPSMEEGSRARSMRRSLSLMIKYAPMDPFDTMAEPERIAAEAAGGLTVLDLSPRRSATFRRKDSALWDDRSASSGGIGTRDSAALDALPEAHAGPAQPPPIPEVAEGGGAGGSPRRASEHFSLRDLCAALWPCMAALFLVGLLFCVVFPFFTYVPSSGAVGDSLPEVLFFIRLFADLAGRTLPRLRRLSLTSQRLLFALACLALATVPLFFLYMKAPPRLLNDYVVIGYVVCLWGTLGYINTCCYILAPQRVPAFAKGAANGALAIIYQGSHCTGLALALALALLLYGRFDV